MSNTYILTTDGFKLFSFAMQRAVKVYNVGVDLSVYPVTVDKWKRAGSTANYMVGDSDSGFKMYFGNTHRVLVNDGVNIVSVDGSSLYSEYSRRHYRAITNFKFNNSSLHKSTRNTIFDVQRMAINNRITTDLIDNDNSNRSMFLYYWNNYHNGYTAKTFNEALNIQGIVTANGSSSIMVRSDLLKIMPINQSSVPLNQSSIQNLQTIDYIPVDAKGHQIHAIYNVDGNTFVL